MGDPTLRQHILAPATNVTATASGNQVMIAWGASASAVAGHHVHRATSSAGPFTRLTPSPVAGLGFTDASPTALTDVYMVRARSVESGSSGSYWNLSQGVAATPCPVTTAIVQSLGSPCGSSPPLFQGTLPVIGQPLTISVSNGGPNATGAVYIGALGVPFVIGNGCTVQLDLGTVALFTSIQFDPAGLWSLTTTVPNDPTLLCHTADFPAVVFESSGIALSNALHVSVGN